MILNKINAEITQENEDQVLQHIGGIRTNLGFLVGLPVQDKKRLTKLSFRYVEFNNYRKKRLNPDVPVNPTNPAEPAVSPGQTA